VPAFLLNPLVENAVKHGAAGTADAPLMLRVDARIVAPRRLRLTVENSGGWGNGGNGARKAEDGLPGGVGLANVRARLAALHPDDHHINIEQDNGYVRVVVELPARFRGEAAT
jgi:LytS/YehU family sensor histidine kinase